MNESSENNITIKKAEGYVLQQVKRFYRDNGMRPQAAKNDDVYIVLSDSRIIAALRLCDCDEVWLLRSMCVAQDQRNRGVGSRMLHELASVLGRKPCFSFPFEHLKAFYLRAGFKEVDGAQVPAGIKARFMGYREKGKKIILMKYHD